MEYSAALYCRLSKDDETGIESASITTQKEMLKRFASEEGFFIYDFYIDDGYSGTNFERPAFQRMQNDIESGKVNMVITKDLSRLGRDYIVSGKLIEEYFPKHNVRYIAITDGFDSDNQYNDIAPFKNLINELYARDTSKKIKSAFIAKMKEGKYIGNFAPYGYLKSPEDKNSLIINPQTSEIVKTVFEMASEGKRPIDIARYLNANHIPPPAVYRCHLNPKLKAENYTKCFEWSSAGIQKMLKNEVYTGSTVQHKTSKISFKSRVAIANDKSEWIRVENTHEPIIDKYTFDMVQKLLKSRRNTPKNNFRSIFSGIAKCSECGSNMSTSSARKKGSEYNLVCGRYKLYGSKKCSNHFTDYNELYNIVLNEINKYISLTAAQKEKIAGELSKLEKKPDKLKKDKEIKKLEARKNDISKIIKGLYEDKYLGRIPEDFFNERINEYSDELNGINVRLKSLSLKDEKNETDKYRQFFNLIDQMTGLTELNAEILHALIEKIVIKNNTCKYDEKGKKTREHHIRIFFRFTDSAR